MDNMVWSRRTRDADGVHMTLRQGDRDIAVETLGRDIIVDGETWALSTPATEMTMSTPGGRALTATSLTDKKLGRTESIAIDGEADHLRLVNEYSTNWVIEDADGTKIGQFTGFHSGVRDVEIDLSECPNDRHPSREAMVLAAWLAKYVLERKVEIRSTIFIGVLGLLSLVAILVVIL